MDDHQLLRYSRHILLDEIGIEGQARILAAHALVIGAGGLGSPVALYLASAGVGHITLVDDDVVDLTNLQRQIAHTTARVGVAKVSSAQAAIAALNSQVHVHAVQARADAVQLEGWVASADVVLDCSDNFATRHLINAACVKHRKPLVSGAAIRFDGQLSVYDASQPQSPCYACVFPNVPDVPVVTDDPHDPHDPHDPDDLHAATFEEVRCATMGVFAPLVGIIGSMQAAEALKLVSGIGSALIGHLLMLDARSMGFSDIGLPRNPACRVCGEV